MDWVAATLELAGLWLVGSKRRVGFALLILGSCAWLVFVFTEKEAYGLVAVVIPAMFINARNWKKWSGQATLYPMMENQHDSPRIQRRGLGGDQVV
jgi:hypothetical protein